MMLVTFLYIFYFYNKYFFNFLTNISKILVSKTDTVIRGILYKILDINCNSITQTLSRVDQVGFQLFFLANFIEHSHNLISQLLATN